MRAASVEMLVDYLGDRVTACLIRDFGGSEILVPKRRGGITWERLAASLGEEDAERFMALFGGERLYIPLDADGQRAQLREMILRQLASGRRPDEIARNVRIETRVTTRFVRRVAAAARQEAEARQLVLPWERRPG